MLLIYLLGLDPAIAAPAPWLHKWIPGYGSDGGYSIVPGCSQQVVTVTVNQQAVSTQPVVTAAPSNGVSHITIEQGVQPVVSEANVTDESTLASTTTVNSAVITESPTQSTFAVGSNLPQDINELYSELRNGNGAVGSAGLAAIQSQLAAITAALNIQSIPPAVGSVLSVVEATLAAGSQQVAAAPSATGRITLGSAELSDNPANTILATSSIVGTTLSSGLLESLTVSTQATTSSTSIGVGGTGTGAVLPTSDLSATASVETLETSQTVQASDTLASNLAGRADAPQVSIIATTISLGSGADVASAATAAAGLFQGFASAGLGALSALIPSPTGSGSSDSTDGSLASVASAVSGGLGDLLGSGSSSGDSSGTSDAVSSVESAVSDGLGSLTGGGDDSSSLGNLAGDVESGLSSIGSNLGDLAGLEKRQDLSSPVPSSTDKRLDKIFHIALGLSEALGDLRNSESNGLVRRADHPIADGVTSIGDGVASILDVVGNSLPTPAGQIVSLVGDGLEKGFGAGNQIASAAIDFATAAAS